MEDDVLVSQVRHALSLGLPELRDFEYPWDEPLRIIANGPSARQAPLDGKTLALNGALQLFTDRGLGPTYWAGCDPQELLADFLTDPPMGATYLVASKCHPRVFEALRGRKVVLWHIDDHATWPLVEDRFPVSTACSVTICAFELMERMGFRSFETWGWDGCLMDGQENAVPQFNGHEARNIIVGDRTFASTVVWAAEAQDAWLKLQGFRWPVSIRGDGMIGAILAYMAAGDGMTPSEMSDSVRIEP